MKKNQIRVNSKLQVDGFQNVFAIGDCTDSNEIHQALYAQKSGEFAADTIANLIQNKKIVDWKPLKPAVFATVGNKYGTGEMNGMVFGSFLVKNMKGKDLFLPKFKKMYHNN